MSSLSAEEDAALAVIAAIHGHAETAAWDVRAESMRAMCRTPTNSRHVELVWQANLLRCLCGNPYQDVPHYRSGQSSTALTLAQATYDEKTFNRLLILADALEDAGVTNPDIPNHCRQPRDHVLGCWALDLVLGKS